MQPNLGKRFEATSIPGSSKFGGQGNNSHTTFDNLKLPEKIKSSLATWSNHSKANGTWSSYRTAERMLLMCQKQYKTKFEWPMTKENTYMWIYWLVEERGLKATTIGNYLSGVRQLHVAKGLEPPQLRDNLVKDILKGRSNMEASKSKVEGTGKGRLPMTIPLMKLLKGKIGQSDMDEDMKLLMWVVSSIAFHGAFRIHELLSTHEATYDPDHTLLVEDVNLRGREGDSVLEICLKCPKEKKAGKPTVVDIFETTGPLCPIKALRKWAGQSELVLGQPLFRRRNGTPLTGRKFNSCLQSTLGRFSKFEGGTISSHSFRSGVASMMGTQGFSDEEIKLVGRWSSRAFSVYTKLPRTQRATMMRRLQYL